MVVRTYLIAVIAATTFLCLSPRYSLAATGSPGVLHEAIVLPADPPGVYEALLGEFKDGRFCLLFVENRKMFSKISRDRGRTWSVLQTPFADNRLSAYGQGSNPFSLPSGRLLYFGHFPSAEKSYEEKY